MENEIENAIDLHYGISGFVDIDSANSESTEISDLFDEAHIVELVDSIITQSQSMDAQIFTLSREKMIFAFVFGSMEDSKISNHCQVIYTLHLSLD